MQEENEEFCIGCYAKKCGELMYHDDLTRKNLIEQMQICHNTNGTIDFDEEAVGSFIHDLAEKEIFSDVPYEFESEIEEIQVVQEITFHFLRMIQDENKHLTAFSVN